MNKIKVSFYTETFWCAEILTLWLGLLFSKGEEDVLFSQVFF